MLTTSWKPDKKSKIPVYKQIISFVREKIARGEWPVGTKIPSQRSLTERFEVNRSTVTYALEELIADGILEGNCRSGTKVVNNTWNMLSHTASPDWNFYIKAGMQRPNLTLIQKINQTEFEPDIIRLGTGELSPQLLSNDEIKQILNALQGKMHSFCSQEPKGLLFLRQQLSIYLQKFGIDVSPSSILIVSGALQALHLLSIGLLLKNSTVYLEKPSYLNSLNVFQSLRIKLQGLPLDDQGLKVETVQSINCEDQGSLLYTVPTFHNPTGAVMSNDRRKELLSICQSKRLPIVEDDAYSELWFDERPPLPLKAFDKNGLVLYMGSTSKVLGSGLRIGWVVGPEPVINRLADIKMQTDYGSSSIAQWVIAEALASGFYAGHLEQLRDQLRERKNMTMHCLNEFYSDLATWHIPKGGFYVWLRLNAPIETNLLFNSALNEGILINPGSLYYPNTNCYIRISFSYAAPSELYEGLYRLSCILKNLNGRL